VILVSYGTFARREERRRGGAGGGSGRGPAPRLALAFPDELFSRRARYLCVELNWDGQLVREAARDPPGATAHFFGRCGELPRAAELVEAAHALTRERLRRRGFDLEAY
jgi:2-oxoglutarate ferredoxin oxidoreductase subunit alpha